MIVVVNVGGTAYDKCKKRIEKVGETYPRFLTLQPISLDEFPGTYIEIVRTPNIWQRTEYCTATYTKNTLENIEWRLKDGNLVRKSGIKGRFKPIDSGTLEIGFKGILKKGFYRVLVYEKNNLGTFVCVTSCDPKYSWILWKAPESEFNPLNAYNKALSYLNVLMEIGCHKFIITSPDKVLKIYSKLLE